MRRKAITREEYDRLTPRAQGFVTYMQAAWNNAIAKTVSLTNSLQVENFQEFWRHKTAMEIKQKTTVVICLNGMVLVFDQDGQQIPSLQGRWDIQKQRILTASCESTEFEFEIADWREAASKIAITREQAARLNIALQETESWPGVIPAPEPEDAELKHQSERKVTVEITHHVYEHNGHGKIVSYQNGRELFSFALTPGQAKLLMRDLYYGEYTGG